MDLISTVSLLDLVTGVSIVWLFGALGAMILSAYKSSPVVQTVVNTTLAVLETTEVVWRPVVNASLILLKPIGAFALQVLKPFGPLALVVVNSAVKALVVFGYVTTMTIMEGIYFLRYCFVTIQNAGMSVSLAISNAFHVTKDFAFSLATLMKAFTYFLIRIVNTASYIVSSFEQVGDFLYTLVFSAHKITWQDVYTVSIPFVIVGSIVGYIAWRASSSCRRSSSDKVETLDDNTFLVPRRSARLLRKRAMMLADDLSSAMSPCSHPKSA